MWGAHFADMQLISKFNKGIRFLLCILDIFSNSFQKILDKSGRKPNKIWVDKGSEFCNISMKSWLQDHNTELYSTDNEKKICCCRKIKVNNIQYDIVNKYNSTYHRTIKMKSEIRMSTLVKKVIIKNLNFKFVIMQKYPNTRMFFSKGCTSNWSEEVFVIKKVKNTVPWIYDISDTKLE